jgi:hypothetical protein
MGRLKSVSAASRAGMLFVEQLDICTVFIVAAEGNALHVCVLAVHYAVYLSSKSSALKLGSVFKQRRCFKRS